MLRRLNYHGTAITFDFDGQTYVNATEMAKPFSKPVAGFLRLKSTQEFIDALSSDMQICTSQLLIVRKGNFSDDMDQGTWMHELLALEFAGWLSPAFKIWCNKQIRAILTEGHTTRQPVAQDQGMNMLRIQMKTMNDMFEQIEAGQQNMDRIEQKVDVLEARIVTMPQDYFAIAGYASLIHRPISVTMAATLGRMATRICKYRGYTTGTIPDPRFGKVRTYPREALEQAFREYFG